MAIKVSDKFGNRANPPSSAYPTGSIKDETSPGTSNDGTPLDSDWGNDFEGFKQSVLDEGGVAANGNPDSVLNPQILDAIKSITDDRFNYDGLVYVGVGNISDFAGQQLQENDKTNAYQYPDNSRKFYAADKSQTFPITIPADPTATGSGWALVNGLTSDSLSKYTSIVYKTSGGNSAVENMIAGIPIPANIGDICKTNSSTWECINSPSSSIDDFICLDDLIEFPTVTDMKSGSEKINGTTIDARDLTAKTTSYYNGWSATKEPKGGSDYSLTTLQRVRDAKSDPTWVPDGYSDHYMFGGTDYVAYLDSEEIDLHQSGCKPDDYSFDNVDRIKSAISKGRGVIPLQTFFSTPIRLGAEFNNKSLVGYGIKSTISLIDGSTSGGIPLLHIPQDGGSYGGTEVGAIGFFADMFSLKGSDATSTTTTTGLVVENSIAFKFGTLWTHGFYKSGAIFTGTCTLLDGDTLTSFNNGNQAGALTGGQGVAFSLNDSEDIQGRIDRIVGYNNGLSNFGQALDWVEGNIHLGTLHAYDNGSSAMKIVRPSKGRIDNLISQANNKHAGNGFPCLYTNGDFGEFHINYFESDNAAASGIAHTKTGLITIDTANIKNSGSNTLSVRSESGKVSRLNIGKLIANGPSTNLINQSGDSYLEIGEMELSNCPNQGLVLDGTETRLGIITITDSTGLPLWLRGGDITITDAKIVRSDLSGSTACLVDAAVSNAAILNLKTKGYSTPLSDSGTATYKPNVVSL